MKNGKRLIYSEPAYGGPLFEFFFLNLNKNTKLKDFWKNFLSSIYKNLWGIRICIKKNQF